MGDLHLIRLPLYVMCKMRLKKRLGCGWVGDAFFGLLDGLLA